MADIFKEFYKAELWYNDKYRSLVERFTTIGKGSDERKFVEGRSFNVVYEFYMYAFFLGIAEKKTEPLIRNAAHKFLPIAQWSQHTDILHFLFMSILAKADIELIELEDMEEEQLRKKINELVNLLQQYANGGLEHIYNLDKDDPEYFYDDTAFVRLLKER